MSFKKTTLLTIILAIINAPLLGADKAIISADNTIGFSSLPRKVIYTQIAPHLDASTKLNFRLVCSALRNSIVIEKEKVLVDLAIDPAITTPQLKNPRSTALINLLQQNLLKINRTTLQNVEIINVNNIGFEIFCTMISVNTTLKKLELIEKEIYSNHTKILVENLSKNTSISELCLARNKINNMGAQCIADMLTKNRSLTTLNIVGNKIHVEGMQALANMLTTNTTLKHLYLHGNYIDNKVIQSFADAVTKNSTLTWLKLGQYHENISDSTIQSLVNMFKKNRCLTAFILSPYSDRNRMSDENKQLLRNSAQDGMWLVI